MLFRERILSLLMRLSVLFLLPSFAMAGVCEQTWDGDVFMVRFASSPATAPISLQDSQKNTVATITYSQVQAFHAAKERIARQVGRSPALVICSGRLPNAFATSGDEGDLVAVTVGMLKIVDGDGDEAGYVVGHEMAHHALNHRRSTSTRETVAGLLELVAGVMLEKKAQKRNLPGLGFDIANIGRRMVTAKFTRDQEREADDYGMEYLVKSGFDPEGAIRLATTMERMGLGGAGLFFDTHPGWEERATRFRTMIAENPTWARHRYASRDSAEGKRVAQDQPARAASMGANAEASSQQALYIEALQQFRAGDSAAALDTINTYLSGNPKDAQGRFFKGIVLTERSQYKEAIKAFSDLIIDNPELPEPYNNLAVLYAAQGQYDRAKQNLEMAIRTHPSYATAHENLGDIYLKLASLAYDKAQQLDQGQVSASQKLQVIRQVFSPNPLP